MTGQPLPDQGVWTIWPCEHGNVTREPGFVPKAHACAVCGALPIHVVPASARDRLAGEVERLRAALHRIAGLTYDTQYLPMVSPGVLRFAGELHDIARAAAELAPASDEQRRCGRCAYDGTPPTTAEHAMCEAEGGHQWETT